MSSLLLILLLPASWFMYNVSCLVANYRQASRLGIPRVWVLISPDNPLWIAVQTRLPSIFTQIPFHYFAFSRYSRLGWEFHDRYRTHLRLGDAWVLVTPNRNWVYVAEAKALHDIFSRNRDFNRPVWMMEMLDVFGPSVSTAQGTDWQRQRKLTATPFNEQKSGLVWAEAIRQASDMLKLWLSQSSTGITSTSGDVRTLALHVLAYVGFQKSYPFRSVPKDFEGSEPSTYRDSLSIILKNVLIIIVVPVKVFGLPFLPMRWKRVGWAVKHFRSYMLGELAKEKELLAQGKAGSGTLMSNLVRASEEKHISVESSQQTKPLTVDEILGNVFVFNFAGHDTTAISLAYSMLLLVANPEVQDWISEEMNCFIEDRSNESWSYEANYEKLKRTRAVLLETVRLYNPLLGIPKYTGSHPCALKVNDQTINIPYNTVVAPNMMAIHTHPRYWGTDSLTWRPSRWILPASDVSDVDLDSKSSDLNETILVPEKGAFIAWSEGPQNCPGKKFAQVEFVATMVTLFRNHKVEPVPLPSETPEQARGRVLNVVQDSSMELLLQMRDPDSVRVRWSRR